MSSELFRNIIVYGFFCAPGAAMVVKGVVSLVRYALIKYRGAKATAAITSIVRELRRYTVKYSAAAEWHDENGLPRNAMIVTNSKVLLSRHFNPSVSGRMKQRLDDLNISEEIYYNKNRAVFANDKRILPQAILYILCGIFMIALGAWLWGNMDWSIVI